MDTNSNEVTDKNGSIFNEIYDNNNRKVTIIVIVVLVTFSLLLLILYLGYLYGLQFNECYNHNKTDKIGNYKLAEGVVLSTETNEISCNSECKIKNKNTQSQSLGQYYFDNDAIILGSDNRLYISPNIIKNPNINNTLSSNSINNSISNSINKVISTPIQNPLEIVLKKYIDNR